MSATIEVRAMPADPADIDEVVLTATDGCGCHLERLDEQIAYLAVYRPDNRRVMLHVLVEDGVLRCRLVEDERTAEEKAKDVGGPVLTGEQSVGDDLIDGLTEYAERLEQLRPARGLLSRVCRSCRGSGVSSTLRHRHTSGGHDDRRCEKCGGDGHTPRAETSS